MSTSNSPQNQNTERKQFPLNIESFEGEPYVSMQDLIDMLEGSMSGKGEEADWYLLNLVTQIRGIRLQALQQFEQEKEQKNESNA